MSPTIEAKEVVITQLLTRYKLLTKALNDGVVPTENRHKVSGYKQTTLKRIERLLVS